MPASSLVPTIAPAWRAAAIIGVTIEAVRAQTHKDREERAASLKAALG